MHISKQSKESDSDVDEFDDSDEEKHTNEDFDGDIDAVEEDDDQIEESGMHLGVTPFLSGVLPAGRLRARTKPLGCQAYGLIQVRLMEMSFMFFYIYLCVTLCTFKNSVIWTTTW